MQRTSSNVLFPSSDRAFRWISSTTGDAAALSALNQRMSDFYSQAGQRQHYQSMLNAIAEDAPPSGSVGGAVLDYIKKNSSVNTSLLEVGCGNGRLYRQLRKCGFGGRYTGVEMAEYIIKGNKQLHPEANWMKASIYEIPFPDKAFDICLSFYVLEHTVYPEQALREMFRILKPASKIVLVFPDFVASRRLASQQTGFSPGSAKEKLKRGEVMNALVSFYDSRFRLRRNLQRATARYGPFPVNLRPLCLTAGVSMSADIDATYIASKQEVQQWAESIGCHVEYPVGKEEEFQLHSFLVISKAAEL